MGKEPRKSGLFCNFYNVVNLSFAANSKPQGQAQSLSRETGNHGQKALT